MKHLTLPLLLGAGMLSLMSFTTRPGSDATPQPRPERQLTHRTAEHAKAETTPEDELLVIVDEDFSGLVKGTEDLPDTDSLLDEMGWVKDPTLFKPFADDCTKGWGGYRLYQAGGSLAMMDGGFVNTPTGNYSGDLTLTFRYKRLPGQDNNTIGNPNVDIILCRRSVLTDFKRETITPTEEWQEYTFRADNGWFFDCMVQFYNEGTLSWLIDDVKITHTITGIAPPVVMDGITQGDESFIAYWQTNLKATEHLVSVFHKVESPDNIDTVEGWEGLKASADDPARVDAAAPGYPERWEVSLTEYGSTRELYTEPEYVKDGRQAICFDADGDYFATPVSEGNVVTELSLWVKLDNSTTGALPREASLDIYLMSDAIMPGDWYLGHSEYLSDLFAAGTSGTIDIMALLNSYGYPPCDRIKVVFNNIMNEPTMLAIDRVTCKVPAPQTNEYFLENHAVSATGLEIDSLIVTGLDPDTDYYYSVKARNEEYESPSSDEMEVYDVSDPVALEATDMTETGYTAHWTSNNKVDYFSVQQHIEYTATEDMPEYVLLEEDFSKVVSDGTAENPETGEYRNGYDHINDYTHMPGWQASSYSLAGGMIGGLPTEEGMEAVAGCIITPEMNFVDHNEGRFDVYIRAYAEKGEWINVQGTKDPYITSASVEFRETGWKDIVIEGMSSYFTDEALAIFVNQFSAFMIDHIKIVQPVKAGEAVKMTCGTTVVDDPSQRSAAVDYAYFRPGYTTTYSVKAYRYYHGNTRDPWESPRSNEIVIAHTPESAVESIESDRPLHIAVSEGTALVTLASEAAIRVYATDGRLVLTHAGTAGVNRLPLAPGLYLIQAGDLTGKAAIR